MRAYVLTTGAVFGLLVLAHIGRAIVEGPHVISDPFFAVSTALAAALCIWSWRVLRLIARQS